jgi:thioredoxin-like negative regulator of GroEL
MLAFAQTKNSVVGVWQLAGVKTSDENLNNFMQLGKQQIPAVVTFTNSGKVEAMAGTEKYSAAYLIKDKLLTLQGLSGAKLGKIADVVFDMKMNKDSLTLTATAESTRNLVLAALEAYSDKSGNDALLATMLKAAVMSSEIRGIVIFKRK